MKILKKIGIGFLALIICFCSCFKSVDAFQSSFVLNSNGPIYQSYIGSISLAIGRKNGSTATNDVINLQTDFYLPDNLNTDFGLSTSRNYGIENKFIYNQDVDDYFVSQEIYFNGSDQYTYQLHFTDIYVYQNSDLDLPILTIDNGYANFEQMYDFTYKGTIFDTTTQNTRSFEDDNPKQLITDDYRYFTYPLIDLFKDIGYSDRINSDYSHGGLSLIKDLTITIDMIDTLSSNYPTTIAIENLDIGEYNREYAFNEFISGINEYKTSGVFGWLLNSIDAFMSAELFPNFSIGVLLGAIVAIPLLIYILRLFMGG